MTANETAAHKTSHVVLYACKYTPTELLAGFGATAELAEPPADGSFETAERLMSPNLCGFAKGLLERLLEPDVHEAVLVTCCDAVRRVYDVASAQKDFDFLYLLDLPHRRGPREVALFRERLADLAAAYGAYVGRPFDTGKALAAFEPLPQQMGDHVAVLGAHASQGLMDAVRGSLGLPVTNGTCTGRHVLPSPPATLGRAAAPGDCAACEDDADAASGPGDPGRAGGSLDSFLDWYAEALLNQTPCMRMDDVEGRESLWHAPGQRGVVYHTMKFCDYYAFELMGNSPAGDEPLVRIETDGTSQSAGQLATRLEAFDETLGHMAGNTDRAARADGKLRVMGIDSGSTSTDAVILDQDGKLLASVILATGAKAGDSARRAEEEVLKQAGLTRDDLSLTVATGYGRDAIPQVDTSITEITCHARGAHCLMPSARTVIDIGGQDSKVIHLAEDGSVLNFVMNDKCAAGTGRFMEMMARTLEMPLEEFCETGLAWKHDVTISSMCTVFAESEVVSLVARDTPVPDIIHGLDESVARKTSTLARRVDGEAPYLMTGGVAHNEGVVKALEDVLGAPVATHEDSQLCGALGAALLGLESLQK